MQTVLTVVRVSVVILNAIVAIVMGVGIVMEIFAVRSVFTQTANNVIFYAAFGIFSVFQ